MPRYATYLNSLILLLCYISLGGDIGTEEAVSIVGRVCLPVRGKERTLSLALYDRKLVVGS